MAATSQDHGETACLIKQDGKSCQPNEAIHEHMPLAAGKASSHEGHPKQHITFSDLPSELRNMIWKAALMPRVIILKPQDRTAETNSPTRIDFNKIPGMLFANRESRLIALRHYDQRFTLTFSERVPTQPDGSTSRLMCRIPVIMSTLDELAFSRPQIRFQMEGRDRLSISIDAAPGAPEPQIERFSLLGDSLVRHGIDTEHLARLLNPKTPEWKATIINFDIYATRYISWRPFSRRQELGLSDQHRKGVESLCIQFESFRAITLDEWLRSGFSSWCRHDLYFVDHGYVDACVFDPTWPNSLNRW
ncbi:hypothetical protein INS49_014199 [Diaporthe citri]|uniref:uncharacterized protein n=1 Tax=Diaporthe citri TaxID=83186 RepID=UPI001C81975D|nr:uncharacterized protein INS49_014199 [Diaporthe citri]KAG6358315.1 hypothetical protein INS49_014199 [Diaporthe citri]